MSAIPEPILRAIRVPLTILVPLARPLGLHVAEETVGNTRGVFVKYMKEDGGAATSKMVKVGDQVVAMSASWGARMWDVFSVESFVIGVQTRTENFVTLRLKRMVPIEDYISRMESRAARNKRNKLEKESAARVAVKEEFTPNVPLKAQVAGARSGKDILAMWHAIKRELRVGSGNGEEGTAGGRPELSDTSRSRGLSFGTYDANLLMTAAVRLEAPLVAIQIFEEAFGFYYDRGVVADLRAAIKNPEDDDEYRQSVKHDPERVAEVESKLASLGDMTEPAPANPVAIIKPNAFVCTTAAKAFGRLGKAREALYLIPWLESMGGAVDHYLLTAVLFVACKESLVTEAEDIFWREFPARGFEYTSAVTNSLLYLYCQLVRVEDALKVFTLATKTLGLKSDEVTFGMLTKVMLKSRKKNMLQKALYLLETIPSQGITPHVKMYNQFFRHFSDALRLYQMMVIKGVRGNLFTYMYVIKCFFNLRDGISAVQVLLDMKEKGVKPGREHFTMAMFACVTSGQSALAESVFNQYIRSGERADTAMYTVMLRGLLQQNKWKEGYALFNRMLVGPKQTRPNKHTMNVLLMNQLLARRLDEARNTIEIIVANHANLVRMKGKGPSLAQTFRSLSAGLGSYSRISKSIQAQMSGTTTRLEPEPWELALLDRPDGDTLTVIVEAAETLANAPSLEEEARVVDPEFYVELLQALVMEKRPDLARRAAKLRIMNKVKVTGYEVALQSAVHEAEDLVRRAFGLDFEEAATAPAALV
eukprot:gene636-700_t